MYRILHVYRVPCIVYFIFMSSLENIARTLVADHRGLLAADESGKTIQKRFDGIDFESTIEHRRDYRELLFTTVGIEQYISGVILYDETIRQSTREGFSFSDVLKSKGIIPGIKVDEGTEPCSYSPDEVITVGLDGLSERLVEYRGLGAQFAKWRAVIRIDDGLPTERCILENADALAGYARYCQEAGIVPIVEPEVLSDGNHTMERCYEVTELTLHRVFDALKKARVELGGMLLKPNMIVPGLESGQHASPDKVAEMTIRCLRATVPPDVPGIVFLSGGQSEAEATANLNAMHVRGETFPWTLTFSYGRALQHSALMAWAGRPENATAAQEMFLKRARLNSLACQGMYAPEME